jgi:hypothetical protein
MRPSLAAASEQLIIRQVCQSSAGPGFGSKLETDSLLTPPRGTDDAPVEIGVSLKPHFHDRLAPACCFNQSNF